MEKQIGKQRLRAWLCQAEDGLAIEGDLKAAQQLDSQHRSHSSGIPLFQFPLPQIALTLVDKKKRAGVRPALQDDLA